MSSESFLNQWGDKYVFEPGKTSPDIFYNSPNVEKKFQFTPVSEIIKNLKPASWLIDSYLEEHMMALMFGDPGCGKSFVAIDMACCIATGKPYHGNNVQTGAVFYIAGEGHNGLARRFKAWSQKNNVSLDNVPLYSSSYAAQFYDENNAEAVANAVQSLSDETDQKPALIIIDTLARNFGGGDENSTKDMSLFVRHVDQLKDRWNATVLIVHHTGHAAKNRARGATALKGALDQEYRVQKDADDLISIESTKTKDGPGAKPLYLKIVPIPLTCDGYDFPLEGAALEQVNKHPQDNLLKLRPQEQKAFDVFMRCMDSEGKERVVKRYDVYLRCISRDSYRGALQQEGIVASENPQSIRRSIDRIITDLKDKKRIDEEDEYIFNWTGWTDRDGQ